MINTHVSDLFFNLDLEDCWEQVDPPKGTARLSLDRVKQKASWFCDALAGAGGPTVDPDALVEDFYRRL